MTTVGELLNSDLGTGASLMDVLVGAAIGGAALMGAVVLLVVSLARWANQGSPRTREELVERALAERDAKLARQRARAAR